jgi:mercuric ion binding protein
MRAILLFVVTLSLVAPGSSTLNTAQAAEAKQAELQTVTLDVQNMSCSFCPITVRKALEKVPGVVKAKTSYETKTATVTFDSGKTNVEALTKATTDAGYPSTLKQE